MVWFGGCDVPFAVADGNRLTVIEPFFAHSVGVSGWQLAARHASFAGMGAESFWLLRVSVAFSYLCSPKTGTAALVAEIPGEAVRHLD